MQLNLRGSLLAISSVLTGVAQKTLNEYMQQRGGLSTLQLMDLSFPWMTIIGVASAPFMDRPGALGSLVSLSAPEAGLVLASCGAAIAVNYSCTLVLGVTNALALVLLGQGKTCSFLLVGYLLFDRRQSATALAGAALALASMSSFALLKVRDGIRREEEKEMLLREAAMSLDAVENPPDRRPAKLC